MNFHSNSLAWFGLEPMIVTFAVKLWFITMLMAITVKYVRLVSIYQSECSPFAYSQCEWSLCIELCQKLDAHPVAAPENFLWGHWVGKNQKKKKKKKKEMLKMADFCYFFLQTGGGGKWEKSLQLGEADVLMSPWCHHCAHHLKKTWTSQKLNPHFSLGIHKNYCFFSQSGKEDMEFPKFVDHFDTKIGNSIFCFVFNTKDYHF